MEDFRHNLSPVEVKIFLKTVAELTEDLLIRYCFKISAACPQCGQPKLCRGAAVSLLSSSFDKITHEIIACLHCSYKNLTTVLTTERL
jgi:C4-type Zn-finger protein